MYVSPCDPQKCNHVKPTALRREEKIASIDVAQSPGAGQGPAAATACSLPSASRGEADGGARAGPGHRGVRRGCPGLLQEGGSPDLEAGHSHAERQHTRCRRRARGAQTGRRRSRVKAVYCPVGVTRAEKRREEKERLSFNITRHTAKFICSLQLFLFPA